MARDFSGSSSYLSNADGDLLVMTDKWSLSLWAFFDATTANSILVTHAIPANGLLPIVMGLGNGGSEGGAGVLYTGFYNAVGPNNWRVSRWTTPPTGRWLHLCGVWDGTDLSLFVNGRREGFNTAGTGSPAAPNADTDFYLGRNWAGTPYFDGRMENVAIWNDSLSYAEVTYLATDRGIDVRVLSGRKLRSYWVIDQAFLEPDLGPNQLHMTVSAANPYSEPVRKTIPRVETQALGPLMVGSIMNVRAIA